MAILARCAHCGAESPGGASLCEVCGSALRPAFPERSRGDRAELNPLSLHPGQAFGERYVIVEEIGTGGMGRVYKALDRKERRAVALKLLRPELAEKAGNRERFERELSLAKQVNHPNVCRVHDRGEQDGIVYISMEHIDGQSLHDWIQAVGSLSPRQTIAMARQICAGLKAIHGQAIVHRDLKPGNIMITRSGQVVLMDFGLAYHPEAEPLTATGEVLGTLHYLAPEQTGGVSNDPRSDLFSLGLILFEMLTGCRAPGDGRRLPLGLRGAEEVCPAPSSLAHDVPAELDAIVLRCLSHEPGDRFASADELDRALASAARRLAGRSEALATGGTRPPGSGRASKWALAVGTVLVAGAAYVAVLFWPPTGVALAPLAYEGPPDGSHLQSILPLLLEQNLRAAPGLELAPFGSSRTFAPREETRSIAAQLGVDRVLRGEIRTASGEFTVALRLFGSDGAPVWSGTYRGDLTRLAQEANRMARDVAGAMGTELRSTSLKAPSPRALELYLRGKTLLEGWDVERNYERAREAFLEAIELESEFAGARAGLALALWRQYEETRRPELVERALGAAERAVSLDSDLPEAHLALGVVQLGRGRSIEAAASFEKAQALAPADDAVRRQIGDAYAALGREEEARRAYESAIELRPGYWESYNYLGVFYLDRDPAEARRFFTRVTDLRPESDVGFTNLAAAYIVSGDFERAEPLLRAAIRIHPTAESHSNLGFVYYSSGRFEEAAREFERAIALGPESGRDFGNLGDSYRQLGRREDAENAYARAIELGEARLNVNPRDHLERAAVAMRLAGAGRCEEAKEEVARSAAEAVSARAFYYAAIAEMICGNREAAVRYAVSAIDRGGVLDVRTNPDLEPLLGDPRVDRLLR